MIREALADTIGLLKRRPLLWLSGLIIAAVTAGDILITGSDSLAGTGSFQILALLVYPFIIAAGYGIIREDSNDPSVYLRYGLSYYFRVLLPLLVIIFASIITIMLVIGTTMLIGIPATADFTMMIAMWVMIPIFLFTYFYDTFVVFRDEKIFDSLRASITLVMVHGWKVLLFIAANIIILLGILFGLAFLWMGLLWEKMTEVAEMDPDLISEMTGDEVMALLGPDALMATAVVLFIWALIATPFTLAFKAAFFRRLEKIPVVQQEIGEYDEKGRWYKY
ncbi:DUF7847 domain-containing protein [Methanocalculus chunghsingensis]|nr:hypothetical protein [Methanocalculus chunghsingensis]